MTTIYVKYGVVGETNLEDNGGLREEKSTVNVQSNENHNGVMGIRFECYGDSTDSAFLEVYGLDQDAVIQKWNQVAATADSTMKDWWKVEEVA